MSPKSVGRRNGELEITNPRWARGLGPLEIPSPTRTCETQGLVRHTPVQDPSKRTLPSRGGPALAMLASSEPPMRLRPRPVE